MSIGMDTNKLIFIWQTRFESEDEFLFSILSTVRFLNFVIVPIVSSKDTNVEQEKARQRYKESTVAAQEAEEKYLAVHLYFCVN